MYQLKKNIDVSQALNKMVQNKVVLELPHSANDHKTTCGVKMSVWPEGNV